MLEHPLFPGPKRVVYLVEGGGDVNRKVQQQLEGKAVDRKVMLQYRVHHASVVDIVHFLQRIDVSLDTLFNSSVFMVQQ